MSKAIFDMRLQRALSAEARAGQAMQDLQNRSEAIRNDVRLTPDYRRKLLAELRAEAQRLCGEADSETDLALNEVKAALTDLRRERPQDVSQELLAEQKRSRIAQTLRGRLQSGALTPADVLQEVRDANDRGDRAALQGVLDILPEIRSQAAKDITLRGGDAKAGEVYALAETAARQFQHDLRTEQEAVIEAAAQVYHETVQQVNLGRYERALHTQAHGVNEAYWSGEKEHALLPQVAGSVAARAGYSATFRPVGSDVEQRIADPLSFHAAVHPYEGLPDTSG